MLRKIIINTASAIGFFLSFIFRRKMLGILAQITNGCYSGWVKANLKGAGSNFGVQYPMEHAGLEFITIGDNFYCFSRLRLEAFDRHLGERYTPIVEIGNDVSINYDCHIACVDHIKIGNGVLIASKVFITDHFHGGTQLSDLARPPSERKLFLKGPVIIGDNVWIGEGVAIMPGLTIGSNSIIGANAVVTKSFPVNSIIAGNPAKLIRTIE